MLKVLLITFIPVSGCITGYERDTERGIWPAAYDSSYYVVAWRERFIVKPGRIVWRDHAE